MQSGLFHKFRSGLSSLISLASPYTRYLTSRQRQELIDTKLAILSCTQHKLRAEARQHRQLWYPIESVSDHLSQQSATNVDYSKEAKYYLDRAIDTLEEQRADEYTIDELRVELQTLLQNQTCKIFENFRSSELILDPYSIPAGGGAVGGAVGNSKKLKQRRMEEAAKLILLREYTTLDKLYGKEYMPFRRRKRQLMHKIIMCQGWDLVLDDGDDRDSASVEPLDVEILWAEKEVEQGIADQAINLAKASLIKKDLGYSVLLLQSTIENAGKGLFLDGRADAGSIVAFFPGQVWPREYLLDSRSYNDHFANDENYELSMRYDGVVIDSRRSSLMPDSVNPWAVAHLANHPPPGKEYNCRPVLLNFTDSMGLDDGLKRYVPNTYAREPKLLGPKAVEGDVFMHGLVLLTTRDVVNEEVFYNYRLNPDGGEIPPWYMACDAEENKNRWGD